MLEEYHKLTENCELAKWFDATLEELSPNLIEQTDNVSETLDYPPPVFVPDRGNGTTQTQNEDSDSMVPINTPEGAPPNIPNVILDDISVTTSIASAADSCNPDEPDPD